MEASARVVEVVAAETFVIPGVNFAAFSAKLAKLSKRAKKLGVEGVGFKVLREFVEERTELLPDGRRIKRKVPVVEVAVSGARVKLAGWTFVGRLDFTAAAPAVLRMMVPGETCPVEAIDATGERCDHCKLARYRADSFVVRHEDGRVMVVGRSCLADFLGHKSPEKIAKSAELLCELREAAEESERWSDGPAAMGVYSPAAVLALAAYFIRTEGWVKAGEDDGYSGRFSTRSRVMNAVSAPRPERDAAYALLTEADHEIADATIEWAFASEASSDYMHNVKASLKHGVTFRTMGIAVSAVMAYSRAMEREIAAKKAKPSAPSEHIGKAGEKLSFTADVTGVTFHDGAYGVTTIVKLCDDSGNVYTWFASGSKDIERGKRYAVRGTVKGHDEYRGVRGTILTRCKLELLS